MPFSRKVHSMKFLRSKEWILQKAKDEVGFEISAGGPYNEIESLAEAFEETSAGTAAEHCAFGTLIQFLRRDRKLSIHQLAQQARIEAAEIIGIECDVRFMPKPRTLHQLADFFGLPEKKLLELSNLTTLHTPDVQEAAIRFAANAKNVTDLNQDERRALNDFVKFLGSR